MNAEFQRAEKAGRGSTVSLIVVFIVGFILGGGTLWLWQNRPTVPRAANETDNTSLENRDDAAGATTTPILEDNKELLSPITADIDEVNVKDQRAGASVFLTRVSLTAPSWIVIHEDIAEAWGNILGAQRFDAGVYQGSVDLLRGMEAGAVYYAVIYRDDGDKLFDRATDQPLADASGVLVFMKFEAY